jgi:hypothetical protein
VPVLTGGNLTTAVSGLLNLISPTQYWTIQDPTLFFDFAWDGSSQAGNQYYIPMNIIIDHTMVVRYREYGFNENGVKNKIDELIGEMKSTSVVGDETKYIQPLFVTLHAAYPNPFNPWTNISFTLAEETVTDIIIYNSLGSEVA